MRLLLVEDNDSLAHLIEKGCANSGFSVNHCPDLATATTAVAATSYDAAIVDLGLPDGDGGSLITHVRGLGLDLPMLILSARDGVGDRVGGLNAGADDYLTKPFEMAELIARLRALLRRPGAALGVVLECGNVTLDTTARDATVDGSVLPATRMEIIFLEFLMRRFGRVVPKEVLLDGMTYSSEGITPNAVEVTVHRLRKKLIAHNASIAVHTVRGVGYLLDEISP
ncbi:transcriptional regulatory protein QseB [Rhodobiaceae bacterium]|nr:transcriptional regulatory protein QseB [Rhodobiaceae bacterium]